MASFEFLAVTISILGLAASIIYYANILNNANKTQKMQLETRQARLFMEIYVRFSDQHFWNMVNEIRAFDYLGIDDFREKYSDYDLNKAQAVGSVFEGIGILVKRNLIDIKFVNDLMPLTVMSVWEKLEPIINEMRRTDWSSSYAFKGFDFLNKAVHKTYHRHLQEWDNLTREI